MMREKDNAAMLLAPLQRRKIRNVRGNEKNGMKENPDIGRTTLLRTASVKLYSAYPEQAGFYLFSSVQYENYENIVASYSSALCIKWRVVVSLLHELFCMVGRTKHLSKSRSSKPEIPCRVYGDGTFTENDRR